MEKDEIVSDLLQTDMNDFATSNKKPRYDTNSTVDIDTMPKVSNTNRICPYLDTVNRSVQDIDFAKICCITLSSSNVYGCQQCGKYFQGRSPSTPAYIHSLEEDHHVFVNLTTRKFYCLPDNYLVEDPSLEDIVYNLHPTYTLKTVKDIKTQTKQCRAHDGTLYYPGIVGQNNIGKSDWQNSVIQLLLRIEPLRDFFLLENNYINTTKPVTKLFGEIVCKLYNPIAFKSHVSPQLLLEAIGKESNNTFVQGIRSDPFSFLRWFFMYLENDPVLIKKDKKNIPYTIVDTCCRGIVRIKQQINPKLSLASSSSDSNTNDVTTTYTSSLFLSLPLPSAPIFPDVIQKQIQVPEVTLHNLLQRFNDITKIINPDNTYKQYKLVQLPPYLIMHIARFTRTEFFIETNPTHVRFPLRGLNMKEWIVNKQEETLIDLQYTNDILQNDTIDILLNKLKEITNVHNYYIENYIKDNKDVITYDEILKKLTTIDEKNKSKYIIQVLQDIQNKLKQIQLIVQKSTNNTIYDLIGAVCHESSQKTKIIDTNSTTSVPPTSVTIMLEEPKDTNGISTNIENYYCYVYHKPIKKWYEIRDLTVHSDKLTEQIITASQAYILLYERRDEVQFEDEFIVTI